MTPIPKPNPYPYSVLAFALTDQPTRERLWRSLLPEGKRSRHLVITPVALAAPRG